MIPSLGSSVQAVIIVCVVTMLMKTMIAYAIYGLVGSWIALFVATIPAKAVSKQQVSND